MPSAGTGPGRETCRVRGMRGIRESGGALKMYGCGKADRHGGEAEESLGFGERTR